LQKYTKEVRIVIAATAATPCTMDEKEIERRKRKHITDDDDNDDDNDDDDDKDDYDKDEDKDDESSNDVDDEEVVDKYSNPLGINNSLACPNKGREKRSGSNVVNVARGCKPPPPPPRVRPHHPPMGGRRGADRTLPLSRRGASVHLEQELIQRRGGKRKRKKRRNTSSSPPHGNIISHNSSSNTLGTYDSPLFVSGNVGPETFSNDITDNEYMCSYCQVEYSACSHDPQNPSLPFLFCKRRFCQLCIETMKGGQDCPVNNCR